MNSQGLTTTENFNWPATRFAPESLTWLCLHNRGDTVVLNCVKVASFNGQTLSPEVRDKIYRFAGKPAATAAKVHSFIDCFRTPNVRRTTILCCLTWYGRVGICRFW